MPELEANEWFQRLYQRLEWKQGIIQLFGKRLEPRLSCWYGDSGASYTYSGKKMQPLPWNSDLIQLKDKIAEQFGFEANSVLCNLYRNGADSMGLHSDDEPELGSNPTIVSLSLGQSRRFRFKHKALKRVSFSLSLTNGSLLWMSGATQHFWLHELPKDPNITGARINLTFRKIFY